MKKKLISFMAAAAMALSAVPAGACASNFEEDLFSRIRSGETTADADLDGDIDLDDAQAVLRYYGYKMSEMDGPDLSEMSQEVYDNIAANIDLDGDGRADAADVTYILRYYYFGLNNAKPGDADNDGNVDAADASAVMEYYSSAQTGADPDIIASSAVRCMGDFNGDGAIDSADASDILVSYTETMTE